jgi:hypothetical protein
MADEAPKAPPQKKTFESIQAVEKYLADLAGNMERKKEPSIVTWNGLAPLVRAVEFLAREVARFKDAHDGK